MKHFLLVALFSLSTFGAFSQIFTKSEFGFMIGGSNYIGDINPKYNFYGTNLMLGAIYRYNIDPRWTIRGSLLFGSLSAEDAKYENIRNLSFQSKVNEISATVEFNFFSYQTGSRKHRITPYLFGGIGVFFINPKAKITNPLTYEEEIVELKPLATEGQGLEGYETPYSLTQISIPFGLGVKFSLSNYICVGLEWGLRMTFTDYIDDVSTNYVNRQTLLDWSGELAVVASDRTNEIIPNKYNPEGSMRGNPQTKDWYQFFGVTLTTKLSFFNKKNKCITF
ncbi:MAG: porin family protein [Bacteroidales bacterium]|jgi:hypothetical protein|nr:porin family protein [Bacteroidales bacterium]